MNHLAEIQAWLRSTTDHAGLVIPSTDEFLSEFSPPANRRLLWATGFQGSTGLAIVLRQSAALFLDGRYVLQAAAEVRGTPMTVEAATLASRRAWLRRSLAPGARLCVDPWLHSITDLAQWRSLAEEIEIELEMLESNPLDHLWGDARPPPHRPRLVDFPPQVAGKTCQEKCAELVQHLKDAGLHALLLADAEDVSWLLNVRAAREAVRTEVGEWHIVPSCASRALVQEDGTVTWFVDTDRLGEELLAREPAVKITPPGQLIATLRDCATQGVIAADLRRTPAALAAACLGRGDLRADDVAARHRWCKHPAEIAAARRAHILDAAAVIRFIVWLTRTVRERVVTEFEAAQVLQALRAEHPDFIAPSMPSMSASGVSGAQPHYVPNRHSCRRINDHPLFWMDSGGHYPGGTTDNTITLAVGPPQAAHVLAHTLVLQGFIALSLTRMPVGTHALRLDSIARQALWREGMDYDHGTGHGVGNCLNIHEGPLLSREPGPLTSVPLEPGMIVTNEPGYYAEDFGLRIESHMVVVPSRHRNFLEFEVISRLPIDPHLVDFTRLSATERQWLASYHRTVLADLEPLLDTACAAWLRKIAEMFAAAGESPLVTPACNR